MPDWKKEVRRRIADLELPTEVKEEVIAELAAHLEDCEDNPECHQEVSAAFRDVAWQSLARAIRKAKGEGGVMNSRTRTLWLPAMANLTLYTILLYIGAFCFDERVWTPRLSPASHTPLPLFHPWLVMLPLCGAVGALVAKRSEAPLGSRVIAGLAPSLIWLAVFAIMSAVFVCAPSYFRGFPMREVAMAAFGWILIPALLLLLGTVPFLRPERVQD
jgi:hypothetical protein